MYRAEPHDGCFLFACDYAAIAATTESAVLKPMLAILQSALLDTLAALHHRRPHLWDLVLLKSSAQDASTMAQQLQRVLQPDITLAVPCVRAMALCLVPILHKWRQQLRIAISTLSSRLHHRKPHLLKVSAALSGPLCRNLRSNDRNGGVGVVITGFMMNFGLSGGMNPRGDRLATQRWWDVALYMCELHADWGFGVGCRRPPDLEIHSAIPDYPFLVTGHASLDYGTVVVFCKPVMRNWCQWLPHISHSARTAWVHLHEREVWSCLYVPPRTSGRMEERRQVVDQYFREWDSAVTQFGPKNGRAHLKASFFGCGDLNMHDDIRQVFESHLSARGLSWLSSTERPTHNKGRTLDFFWGDASNNDACPVLHDGKSCSNTPSKCNHPACGRLHEFFDTHDFDHHAWTFFCHIGQPTSHDNVFVAKFSKDRDAWSAAMNLYGNDFFHILCMEIDALLHPCSFLHTLRLSDCRVLANACAILWEVSTAMIGYCAGLVNVKPQLRTPKVPFAVKAAFNAMVQASKFVSRCPSDPCAQQALILARKGYRSAVKACKKQVVANRNARYMALSQAKDPQADVYLAKCLRKGKAGLADFMSLPDGTRFAQDDVVDGAAAYICSLQDAPLCADLSYRLHVEDSFMQTRAEMRSAVDKNPDEIGLDKDTLRLVLKRIKPTAECRGIPYAALLAEAEEHFQFVLLMHKLALTFGVTASVWTMQDRLVSQLETKPCPSMLHELSGLGTQ